MLESLKHYISVSIYFIKMALGRQLEYPSFLVCWLIGNPINFLMGIWMIKVITQRFQALNGWNYPEIAFLYGLSILSHALMVIFFIQTWNMDRMIIRGGFDRMLLRPLNVFFQFCVNYFNLIGITDMIPGLIVFLFGCKMVGFQWTFINIIKLLMVLIGATLIRGSFFTITGSIAFWTKSCRSMVETNLTLFERTTMYPLSIYPFAIQMVFTFLLPFGFISFYPVCDILGKNDVFNLPVGLAIWTPVVGIALEMLASKIFNVGLKRYESSGS